MRDQIINIAIIGLGPTGLYSFERIRTYLRAYPLPPSISVCVHLIDPNQDGAGVHRVRQPDHLLLNTVVSQATMYGPSLSNASDAGQSSTGPTFYEWVSERYRQQMDGRIVESQTGASIGPDEYVPRTLLGRYLEFVYADVTSSLPDELTVQRHVDAVVDVAVKGSVYRILLATGNEIQADYVLLATGHGQLDGGARNPNVIGTPYPIQSALSSIECFETVGIEGFGLSAIDVLSELTMGRGGQFEVRPSGLVYRPSGREPQRIVMYSRSGLPYLAAPINEKGVMGSHVANFFTQAVIDRLRTSRGHDGQLDWEEDVMPVLFREVESVFYATYLRSTFGDRIESDFLSQYAVDVDDRVALDRLVDSLSISSRFCWREIVDPLRGKTFALPGDFHHWLVRYIQHDIVEARRGNVTSPLKAAMDCLRDVRDSVRYVVNNRGLTPESHRVFLEKYAPLFNRLSVGPPVERSEQLLALVDAGILDISVGPAPTLTPGKQGGFEVRGGLFPTAPARVVDIVVRGRITETGVRDNVLIRNLEDRGLLRRFLNGGLDSGGIDIDTENHPVGTEGTHASRIWILGIPTEGARYYTHYLPRVGASMPDIDRCIVALHKHIDMNACPGDVTDILPVNTR